MRWMAPLYLVPVFFMSATFLNRCSCGSRRAAASAINFRSPADSAAAAAFAVAASGSEETGNLLAECGSESPP